MKTLFGKFSSSVLPTNIKTALDRLALDWADKRLDGKMSPSEFLAWMGKALDEAMTLVAPLQDGKTKKEIVLELASYLFDVFEPFIVFKLGWLAWLVKMLTGDSLKDEFLNLVSIGIELFYNAKFKRVTP